MMGVRYTYKDAGISRRIPSHEINFSFSARDANAIRAKDRKRWVRVYGPIRVQHRKWLSLWRKVRAGTPLGRQHYATPRKPRTVRIPHPLPGRRRRRQRYSCHGDQAFPETVMLGSPIRANFRSHNNGFATDK
jgi:hypothetical protein